MKYIFFLFIGLLSISGFSQDTTNVKKGTITIKKKLTEADYWPRVAGKFHGEITPKQLCSSMGIHTNAGIRIVSFDMASSYLSSKKNLFSTSNVLTDDMCKFVSALPSGAIVHLQNIVGIDSKGNRVRLTSLRYTIKALPKKVEPK